MTRRGKGQRAARITFTLNAPGRVVFVVRGPAPSCRVAGRFTVRGDRGVNHVRFTGRVGRRNLPRGTYRITARTRGRDPSRPVVVVVGERRRDGFACASAAPTSDNFSAVFGTFSSGDDGPGSAEAASASQGGTADGRRRNRGSGVLPAVTDRLKGLPGALPRPKMPAASGSPSWIVGMGALLLLVLSALALVVYVVRFVRRPAT